VFDRQDVAREHISFHAMEESTILSIYLNSTQVSSVRIYQPCQI
jgi:hypothetical protein